MLEDDQGVSDLGSRLRRSERICYDFSKATIVFFCGRAAVILSIKNIRNGKMTTVPRHREVKENLVKKICDDLGIKRP